MRAQINELTFATERHQRVLRSLTGWACAVCFFASLLTPWVTGAASEPSCRFHDFLFVYEESCVGVEQDQEWEGLLRILPAWTSLIGLVLVFFASGELSLQSEARSRYRNVGSFLAILGLGFCVIQSGVLLGRSEGSGKMLLAGPGMPFLALAIVCAWARSALPYQVTQVTIGRLITSSMS